MLSRSKVPSEDWMLHLQMVQRIWEIFGKAGVDLFASEDNSYCPVYYSKDRDALSHDWPNLLLYAFPPFTGPPLSSEQDNMTPPAQPVGSTPVAA
ncbi:hypothetical protein H4Q32_020596 [Labeo rohita]|uniref:Uncharacterized protein n=1 Tax=Labeo rohita TaxID=84645 RepID=A0ABQ8LF65_LABRO|nr:hypothetical protein H4Q32_020596 [Labeo rohita]